MKPLKNIALFSLILLLSNSCKRKSADEYNQKANNPDIYHAAVNRLTDVIIV